MQSLPGRATPEATAHYAARFAPAHAPEFFRRTPLGVTVSSIGLGSYLGEADEPTDRALGSTAEHALRSGINVLDSAINYRHQRSEKTLGRALAAAVGAGHVRRDEVVVATKGGFIAFDDAVPDDPQEWFARTFLETGLLRKEDFVAQCHAMNPPYLRDQLTRSLQNLGLETVDVYYLHNPETQLPEVGRPEFMRRLRLAFEWLEEEVDAGRIGVYGLATWDGFRVPEGKSEYLALDDLLAAAAEIVGLDHHFRVIQLPVNAVMREALILPNQGRPEKPFLERADEAGITVMTSASLLQGHLAQSLPSDVAEAFPNLPTAAQRALQFTRSAPGVATALVGMKSVEHLKDNLGVAKVPPLAGGEFRKRFRG